MFMSNVDDVWRPRGGVSTEVAYTSQAVDRALHLRWKERTNEPMEGAPVCDLVGSDDWTAGES